MTNKLRTVVVAALRAYKDIMYINNNKRIMEEVVASSSNLFEKVSIQDFIKTAFCSINSLINLCRKDKECNANGLTALRLFNDEAFKVTSAYGKYKDCVGKKIMDSISHEDFELIKKSL